MCGCSAPSIVPSYSPTFAAALWTAPAEAQDPPVRRDAQVRPAELTLSPAARQALRERIIRRRAIEVQPAPPAEATETPAPVTPVEPAPAEAPTVEVAKPLKLGDLRYIKLEQNDEKQSADMVKQSLPAVSALTKETLEDFKTADKVVIVAYVDADDKTSNETFTKVAESLRDTYLFGGVADAALAEAEGVKAPAIVLYKAFDEGKNTFTDKFEGRYAGGVIVAAALVAVIPWLFFGSDFVHLIIKIAAVRVLQKRL